MFSFHAIVQTFLDALFPPSYREEQFRNLSLDEFLTHIRPSHTQIDTTTTAFFRYKDPILKTALHLFKYKHNIHAKRALAHALYSELLDHLENHSIFNDIHEPYVFVPIPRSKSSLTKYGFNHIELLIKELLKISPSLGTLYTNTLIRIRNTPPQTSTLSREERLSNVVDSFTLQNPETIRDKHILLIDDVITTGATMSEAQKRLEAGKPKTLQGIALAH